MSISRHLRVAILIAFLLALWPAIVAAKGAGGPGTGCAGNPGSAFVQYCEPIPTPTGPKSVGVGTPTIAGSLPVNAVRRITRSQPRSQPLTPATFKQASTRQRLLTLPAPTQRGLSISGAGVTSPWSLSLPLILILAAIALALVGMATVLRRRSRGGASTPKPRE